jgi:hypothetical protein
MQDALSFSYSNVVLTTLDFKNIKDLVDPIDYPILMYYMAGTQGAANY